MEKGGRRGGGEKGGNGEGSEERGEEEERREEAGGNHIKHKLVEKNQHKKDNSREKTLKSKVYDDGRRKHVSLASQRHIGKRDERCAGRWPTHAVPRKERWKTSAPGGGVVIWRTEQWAKKPSSSQNKEK